MEFNVEYYQFSLKYRKNGAPDWLTSVEDDGSRYNTLKINIPSTKNHIETDALNMWGM